MFVKHGVSDRQRTNGQTDGCGMLNVTS